MNQKLFVEMKITKGDSFIMARCPNEDDEMSITVKDRYKTVFSLTLDEAEDLSDYIKSHVKNARESNK